MESNRIAIRPFLLDGACSEWCTAFALTAAANNYCQLIIIMLIVVFSCSNWCGCSANAHCDLVASVRGRRISYTTIVLRSLMKTASSERDFDYNVGASRNYHKRQCLCDAVDSLPKSRLQFLINELQEPKKTEKAVIELMCNTFQETKMYRLTNSSSCIRI